MCTACISIPCGGNTPTNYGGARWSEERTPSRVEGGTCRDGVYADGSLRANARYPGHVRSANRTYCRAHDSSGYFNISAECAEKTVERGPCDEKTKGKERKKEEDGRRKERGKRKSEGGREGETRAGYFKVASLQRWPLNVVACGAHLDRRLCISLYEKSLLSAFHGILLRWRRVSACFHCNLFTVITYSRG